MGKENIATKELRLPDSLKTLLEIYPLLPEDTSFTPLYKKYEEEFRDTHSENHPPPSAEGFIVYPLASPLTSEEILALQLEMQEEIDFQKRQSKEEAALLEVKSILEKQLTFHEALKLDIQKSDLPLDDFMKQCAHAQDLKGMSHAQKAKIREDLKLINLLGKIEYSINFLKSLLANFDKNTPFLLEVLYMNGVKNYALEQDKIRVCVYKQLNHMAPEFLLISKTLKPFLNEEFNTFFAYYKETPNFRKNPVKLNPIDKKLNDKLIQDFIPFHLEKVSILCQEITKKIQMSQNRDQATSTIWIQLENTMVQMKSIKGQCDTSIEKLKAYAANEKIEDIDLTHFSYWEETRTQFSALYPLLKQLEEINHFVDTLELFSQNPKSVLEDVAKTEVPKKAEVLDGVDIVPPLNQVFLPPIMADKHLIDLEAVNAFFDRKNTQLKLWQERIQYRKEQQIFNQKKTASVEDREQKQDNMSDEECTFLLKIYENIKDKPLFDSFFKVDPQYKPWNLDFQNIKNLIFQIGGKIDEGFGSSHFSIELPNTYFSFSVSMVKGGSFKPHGKGDEWAPSAHKLCKEVLIKAGMTPERFEKARSMKLENQIKGKKYA